MSTEARSPAAIAPAWLLPAEMLAWRSYVETYADLMTALEADLVPTGLNLGDYQVLVYLSEAPEHSLRMCDLAVRLQLSPSGLTRRLDGLVRAGLVERRGSDSDRRVMLAALTPAGLARLEAVGADPRRERAPAHDRPARRRRAAVLAAAFQKIRAGLEDDSPT